MKQLNIILVFFFLFYTRSLTAQAIEVGYNTTTTILFPAAIESADYGSPDLLAKPMGKDLRVLKIKAAKENFHPTNITVITKDKIIYSIPVHFQASPLTLLYDYTIPGEYPFVTSMLNNNEELTQTEITSFSQFLASLATHPIRRRGGSIPSTTLHLTSIFLNKNLLFFTFSITNKSNIPYDLNIIRFTIQDKKSPRRAARMEKEIKSVYHFSTNGNTVRSSDQTILVFAFDKFTIADKKHLKVECFEKNGDRILALKISGETILNAPVME